MYDIGLLNFFSSEVDSTKDTKKFKLIGYNKHERVRKLLVQGIKLRFGQDRVSDAYGIVICHINSRKFVQEFSFSSSVRPTASTPNIAYYTKFLLNVR